MRLAERGVNLAPVGCVLDSALPFPRLSFYLVHLVRLPLIIFVPSLPLIVLGPRCPLVFLHLPLFVVFVFLRRDVRKDETLLSQMGVYFKR